MKKLHHVLALGSILFFSAATTFSQERLPARAGQFIPSSDELKAAYCLVVIDQQRRTLREGLDDLVEAKAREPSSEIKETLDTFIASERQFAQLLDDRIDRLSSFLKPRQRHLDSVALLEASDRGKADMAALGAEADRCRVSCASGDSPEECMGECTKQQDAHGRVHRCEDLSFLPF